MDRLIAWTKEQGGLLHELCIQDDRNPRALVAAGHIPAGSTLFRLPQHLLLHGSQAFGDPDYGAAFRALYEREGGRLDKRNLLVMLLLLERCKGSASFWEPYISFLPDTYDDPFWWGEDDLQLLAGSRLARAVEHYRGGLAQLASWMAQLEALRAELQPGSPPGLLATAHGGWALSADGVRWGRSAVWSRAFTVHRMRVAPQAQQADSAAAAAKAAVDERVVALVPLVDMCDHVPEARVAWHMGRDGGEDFQFMTQLPVAQGGALPNNYGSSKPNEELILAYGFLLEGNPHDTYLVSMAVGGQLQAGEEISEEAVQEAADLQQRRQLLAASGLALEHTLTMTQLLPPALLDALAVLKVPVFMVPQLQQRMQRQLQQQEKQQQVQQQEKQQQEKQQEKQQQPKQPLTANGAQPPLANGHHTVGDGGAGTAAAGTAIWRTCPLAQQMAVLLELQQQLQGKLAGLVHYEGNGASPCGALPRPSAAALCQSGDTQQPANGQHLPSSAGPAALQSSCGGSNPAHARMARLYINKQGAILEAALAAVRTEAVALLSRACGCSLVGAGPLLASGAAQLASSGGGGAGSAAAPNGADAATVKAPGQPAKHVVGGTAHELLMQPAAGWLAPGMSLAAGGARLDVDIAPGAPLAVIPLTVCILASGQQQLLGRLMLAAFLVRLFGQEHPRLGPQDGVGWLAGAELRPPVVLELMSCDHVDQLLEGTGVKAAIQQALGSWAAGFRLMQRAVTDVGARRPEPAAEAAGDGAEAQQAAGPSGSPAAAAGAAAEEGAAAGEDKARSSADDMVVGAPAAEAEGVAGPGAQGADASADASASAAAHGWVSGADRQDARLLLKLFDWPAAFQLYCWASDLVERASVEVAGPGGKTWLLMAPLLRDVPKAVRQLLLTVTLNADASAIRVAAATHLPCGLSLAPRQLLANQAAEEVLLENGPTALLGPQPQPPPRPLEGATEAALGGAGGTPATEATVGAARKQQQDAAGGQCAAAGQLELDHLHDVTIMPQEQDTNGGLKLQLMAASGLGPLHLLRRTDGLMQVQRMLACMSISAANLQQLQHPGAQQLLSSYAQQRDRPSLVSATSAMLEGSEGPEGGEGGSISASQATPAAGGCSHSATLNGSCCTSAVAAAACAPNGAAPATSASAAAAASINSTAAAGEECSFLGLSGSAAAWLRWLLHTHGMSCTRPLRRVLRSTFEEVGTSCTRAQAVLQQWDVQRQQHRQRQQQQQQQQQPQHEQAVPGGAGSKGAPSESTPSKGTSIEGPSIEGAHSESAPSEGAPSEGAPSQGAASEVAPQAGGGMAQGSMVTQANEGSGLSADDAQDYELLSGLLVYLRGLHGVVAHWLQLLKSPELQTALGGVSGGGSSGGSKRSQAGSGGSGGEDSAARRRKKGKPARN